MPIQPTDIAFRDYVVTPMHHQSIIEAVDRRGRHTALADCHVLSADIVPAE